MALETAYKLAAEVLQTELSVMDGDTFATRTLSPILQDEVYPLVIKEVPVQPQDIDVAEVRLDLDLTAELR